MAGIPRPARRAALSAGSATYGNNALKLARPGRCVYVQPCLDEEARASRFWRNHWPEVFLWYSSAGISLVALAGKGGGSPPQLLTLTLRNPEPSL